MDIDCGIGYRLIAIGVAAQDIDGLYKYEEKNAAASMMFECLCDL